MVSTAWSNGNPRSIIQDEFDPDDSQLGYHRGSADGPMAISGTGTASLAALSTSHRIFVHGPWTNTEMTVLVKVDTSCSSIQLRSRSNHHGVDALPYGLQSTPPDISCGFGNYETNYDPDASSAWQEVEVIHDCYQRNLDPHTWIPPTNGTWAGYKQITRSIGTDSVKVQGWFNRNIANQADWVLLTEFDYDGTNVNPDATSPNVTNCLALGDSISGNLVANSKWLNPGYWCWLRLNNAENVSLQKWSIREINPANSTTGTGGTGGNPPPPNTDYKIAVSGDWGCETATDNVISLIQDQNYNFTIGVGDNAYESSACWITRFTPLKPNFNSAYGNHEYEETGGINPYKTFFGHSLTYFTFKFQNIQFFVMDTNISISSGSAQHTFITNAITQSLTDNTVTWRIVVMHHPIYGASSTHPYNEFNQAQTYHTFFQNNKINFVFAGHNHTNQRTYQVAYNSGSVSNPTIVDSTSPYAASALGFIHVISGTGGHDSGGSLYSLGSQPSYQAYQNRTFNGVWEMIASNNGQTLTCSFVEINGTKHDTFVINAA